MDDTPYWPWVVTTIAILTVLVVALAGYGWKLRRDLKMARLKLRELSQHMDQSTSVLQQRSSIDALTGVPNRRIFDETFSREWARARRSGAPLSLLMVDIDLFKKHNDTYGHQAGDMCLRQVAATLKEAAKRPADLVARYGGEEFSVILPDVDEKGALVVAEKMRAAVAGLKFPHINSVTGHHVTISVGVASTVPARGGSVTTLIAWADAALYQAKAVGRNQVILSQQAISA
jgi:diguanylate cyclase (GGDEF)-like protein